MSPPMLIKQETRADFDLVEIVCGKLIAQQYERTEDIILHSCRILQKMQTPAKKVIIYNAKRICILQLIYTQNNSKRVRKEILFDNTDDVKK